MLNVHRKLQNRMSEKQVLGLLNVTDNSGFWSPLTENTKLSKLTVTYRIPSSAQ
jgi:hypothetical protein